MNRSFFTLFFLLFCWGVQLQASSISVSGTISIGVTNDDGSNNPASDYPVFIYADFDGDGIQEELLAITDEDGLYTGEFDVDLAVGDVVTIVVEVFDFCTGEENNVSLTAIANDEDISFSDIDFLVCEDFNPPPTPEGCDAYFYYEQTSVDPYLVSFFDLTWVGDDAAIDSWSWSFGDGDISDEPNPEHEYDGPGDYEVVLTINADTCSSSFTMMIYVGDDIPCICPDIFDPVCVSDPATGEELFFFNSCYAECEGYGADNYIDCNDTDFCVCPQVFDPVCVLTPDGFFFFENSCYAECQGFTEDDFIDCNDDCECDDILEPVCVTLDDGTVLYFPNLCEAECAGYGADQALPCDGPPGCHAAFYAEPNVDPAVLTVEFVDISSSTEGDIISWQWDLGDGNTSDEQNPVHTYSEPGIYEILLTIETADGCTSTILQHICIGFIDDCVCPAIYDPVCVMMPDGWILTFPNQCEAECAGFGEDSFVDCEDNGPCDCPDIFDPVCVLGDNGDILFFPNLCIAECLGYGADSIVDCDNDNPCGCDLEYDPVCVVGPDGTVLTFSNSCFAECAGFDEDTFLDDCDEFEPCDDCIEIFAPVCVAIAGGDTLSFTNSCYAECAGYGPDQYVPCDVDFPCDCPFVFDPVCVITPAGEFLSFPNACIAECEGYGEDSFVECDDVPGVDCYADFYTEIADDTGLSILFSDASQSNTGDIVEWAWDFGDGTTSSEQNPEHTYSEEGIYEVLLTIATADGCVSTTVQHICIGDGGVFEGPDCQAMFFFEQEGDDPNTFQFFDMSFGDITSWSWDFGDGNSSNEPAPIHTYENEGIFLVTLTITGENDCESSVTMILISNPDIFYDNSCLALFIPFIVPETNEVFFLNLSSPDAVEFTWDLGDGTTSNEYIVAHTYAEGGTYEVSLTITTPDGCSNTFVVTLDLDDSNFTGNPSFLTVSDTKEPAIARKFKLYPNPVEESLNLVFDTQITGDMTTTILSANGQAIRNQKGTIVKGENQQMIEVSDLTSGLYFIRLQTGDQVQTLKFIKR